MPEKKKSTIQQVKTAVHDAAAAVVHAADEHVIQPVGKALGLTGDDKAKSDATEPAKKPAGTSAAAKMMTRSIAVKKTKGSAKGKAQRAADATKPSQKPGASAAGRPVRRGASKGR